MTNYRIQKHKQTSLLSKGQINASPPPPGIRISLKSIDYTQGQTPTQWQKRELWPRSIDRLRDLSRMTFAEARVSSANCLSVYGYFPPPEKTSFKHPPHIDHDAMWCSFHINGETCLAGHYDEKENLFYIVFLDWDHSFWKVEKKNT